MKNNAIVGILLCGLVGGALAGCSAPAGRSASDSGLGGQVDIDGSTTVYPIVQFMAEDFADANSGVKVTVNKSGTGSGFKKFLAGETDIVTASRPIKETEDREAKEKGIAYIEIPVAYDGICIVVNPDFPLTNITTDQLTKMFLQSSRVQSWRDVDPSAPARKINFYGPSDNHGTFEYFQEAILGKNGNFRKDYQPNQEYNTIIQALGQDQEGIGYVGYNYYAENQNKVKALTVNGVAPTVATIENGTYVPLSRPLFIYVKKSAMDRPAVKAFVDFSIGEGLSAVADAQYVPLPQSAMDSIRKRVSAGTTGSVFMNAEPGMAIGEVLKKESSQ